MMSTKQCNYRNKEFLLIERCLMSCFFKSPEKIKSFLLYKDQAHTKPIGNVFTAVPNVKTSRGNG